MRLTYVALDDLTLALQIIAQYCGMSYTDVYEKLLELNKH